MLKQLVPFHCYYSSRHLIIFFFKYFFSISQLAAKYSTDVVSSVIYGIDSKSFENTENCQIRQNGSSIFESSSTIVIYFTLVSIFPFIKKLYKVVPKSVEQFFQNLLNEAIKMRKESKIEREDFLSYLLDLKEKKNLSKMDMAAHTITFFLDGFETSTAVITYALYHLACNANVQQKLRAEINECIRVNGSLSYESILDMEYLDQVFNGKDLKLTLTSSYCVHIYCSYRNFATKSTLWHIF